MRSLLISLSFACALGAGPAALAEQADRSGDDARFWTDVDRYLEAVRRALPTDHYRRAGGWRVPRCWPTGLSPESVRSTIDLYHNELRAAYERARRLDPGLSGRMVVRFVIAADGHVSKAWVVSSTPGVEALEPAVLASIRGIVFTARSECSADLVITYPLSFRPRRPSPSDATPER